MKRILITGGAGFIGFHLAKYLSNQNFEIVIIDNLSRGQFDDEFNDLISKPNVSFVQLDLTDFSQFLRLDGKFDEIYHLAAINGTKYFYEKPQEVLRVNILALLNILEWITTENCGKLLFTSSSETYAGTISSYPDSDRFLPTKEDIPLAIDDIFNPRYSYGGSKLIGELLTVNYCRTKNIPFSIVRYHNIYAGRMGTEHVIPQFCERIFNKENPFKIFGGNETRAFCYVDDATRATQMVMESSLCDGQVLHIGNSNEEIRIIDLAEKLLKLNDWDPKIQIEPAPEGCVERRCPSTEKLKKLTGYEPKVVIDDGLKMINDWYFKNLKQEG